MPDGVPRRPAAASSDSADERPLAVQAHLSGPRPVPTGSGAAIVLWRNRRALDRAGYRVEEVAFERVSGAVRRDAAPDPDPAGLTVLVARRGPRSRGVAGLLGSWRRARRGAYPPTWPWELPDDPRIRSWSPMLVLSENVEALALARLAWPRARHVVTIHDDDVELEGEKACRAVSQQSSLLRRIANRVRVGHRFLLRRMAHARQVRACETVLALGNQLAPRYRRWSSRVEVVQTTVPDPGPPPVVASRSDALRLLYVGNLYNSHTAIALPFLVERVLPLLRRPLDGRDWGLRVVGRVAGGEELAERLAGAHVTFADFVDDLAAEYHRATCQVVPSGLETGVRVKIVESLSHGVPVVTTAAEAHCLGLSDGDGCVLAESAEQFAEAILALHGDPALRQRVASRGRTVYEERFSPDAVEPHLARLLAPVAGGEAA